MANRTSQHLDFLADHLKIVHVACIFVDFRIADTFQVEISPKCSVIHSNLPWKHLLVVGSLFVFIGMLCRIPLRCADR
jgi:hypothetical protein